MVSGQILIPRCPWLPVGEVRPDPWITRRHGGSKGEEFYVDALRYAQALWCHGKPAQAILQLNKAWMADLPPDAEVLARHPPPYRALIWIILDASRQDRGFLGNPVRHFQHLASRMSGPRSQARSWRAWICFHLSSRALVGQGYDADGTQIAREGLWIPGFRTAALEIRRQGWEIEFPEIMAAMADAKAGHVMQIARKSGAT